MRTATGKPYFSCKVTDGDVAAVKRVVQDNQTSSVRERKKRNIEGPSPEFSREKFWHALIACLVTTKQASTKGSPVDRFMATHPFPLSVAKCSQHAELEDYVLRTIQQAGGIRRGVTISKQAATNWKRLDGGLWSEVEQWFSRLRAQRSRKPHPDDTYAEREAARWADEHFAGLGPKQSRHLWQALGLTRYEIPLDSRVAAWINANLSTKVDESRLSNVKYYESVLDYIQAVCRKAKVLPCEFDAAAFDFEDSGRLGRRARAATEPGFVNPNGQITIRNTGLRGTDHLQYIYQLACSHCGHVYGANGSDIFERQCPKCQGGRPGLLLPESPVRVSG